MDMRNRIGLYGSYFLGMAAIGFTLPYLPLYLGEKGLSDRAIGLVSTLAALSALAQFPVGLWSDRLGWRKPFLVVALAVTALATVLIRGAHGVVWLGVLVVLFAENGIGRAVVESLSGAEAAALAPKGVSGRRSGPSASGSRSASCSWPWWGAGCRSATASGRSCCRSRSCKGLPSPPRC
jgi:MFS family permease